MSLWIAEGLLCSKSKLTETKNNYMRGAQVMTNVSTPQGKISDMPRRRIILIDK
jgi:hypothetical protein